MRWKKEIITVSGLMILLLITPGIFAFGVSMDPTPLKIAPGETKEVPLNIQNMDGDQPITFSIIWVEGNQIAEVIGGTTYTLQPKSEVYVKIKVMIPLTANPGDAYNLKLRLNQIPSEGGKIVIATGHFVEKPVVVVAESDLPKSTPTPLQQEEPEQQTTEIPQSNNLLYGMTGIVLIALIVLIIILRRKKR